MNNWVKCPICGEPDMEREPDTHESELGYINCTNLNCGSNGGDNFRGLDAPVEVRVPATSTPKTIWHPDALEYFAGQALAGLCANPDFSAQLKKESTSANEMRQACVKAARMLAEDMVEELK